MKDNWHWYFMIFCGIMVHGCGVSSAIKDVARAINNTKVTCK